jgi:hypothetical protein
MRPSTILSLIAVGLELFSDERIELAKMLLTIAALFLAEGGR